MIEYLTSPDGRLMALVIRQGDGRAESHFVTPEHLQLQVGLLRMDAGFKCPAHSHIPVERTVMGTDEVLYIEEGLVMVRLFIDNRYHTSKVVGKGDVVILTGGFGHQVEAVTDAKVLEVKQGPYNPNTDKVRLNG